MTPRAVKLSRTFNDQLVDLIEYGEQRYGARLAEEKKQVLLDFIENILSTTPRLKRKHPKLGLVVYPVTDTPFIVLYDFDDREVRIYSVLRKGAGDRLSDIDPSLVEW